MTFFRCASGFFAPQPGRRSRFASLIVAVVIDWVKFKTPRDYGFVMDHGRGCEAWDVDGNRFLDFAAGIAVAIITVVKGLGTKLKSTFTAVQNGLN